MRADTLVPVPDTADWTPIAPPEQVNGDLSQVLASMDALQRAWADVVRQARPEEFKEARARSLRRHAIETGIIERLYSVEWGVTQALVAEGLSAEVAAREGGIDEGALETIKAQFEALELLSETAGDTTANDSDLSVTLIRQLHVTICRTQAGYEAMDPFGRLVQSPLHHGCWKTLPNQVVRSDGTIVRFCPPEQVDSEIDRLLLIYRTTAAALHPVIRAAWLHHAFVSIHPFEDGNGRVARALTLLVLLRNRYAPLVVDRFSRADYISALEAATDGDLRPLVRLFARLEVVALRAELERPTLPAAAGGGAVDVAKAYVERLRALHSEDTATDRAAGVRDVASALLPRVVDYLRQVGASLADTFTPLDPQAHQSVSSAQPGDERSTWWRAQIIRSARASGFYSNVATGTWWAALTLTVMGQRLRYVVVIQKVGRGETGVLALTVFAEVLTGPSEVNASPGHAQLLAESGTESVTFVHSDDVDQRWDEVEATMERTLAAAVDGFAFGLS